jgi:transcription-repair coupling factor (superfamily II helicase)
LGAQQHGHIVQVGYELYAKLVNEAVAALSAQKLPEEDPEIVIDIGVAAFIPEYYITDEALKLQLYKKISSVQSSADIKEVLSEATDMFGLPPRSVRDLAKVALIRHLAAQAGVRRIFTEEQRAVLHFVSPDKFSPQGSARAFKALGSRISISGAKTPAVRMDYSDNDELLDGLIETLNCLIL